ncbi:MAG: carboxypeptidase regulatory-like domain-containing protein, partial [Planctomycetota bacterium]
AAAGAASPVERSQPRPAQGLTGHVADAAGARLPGIAVELYEADEREALRSGWGAQARALRAPLASTRTDRDGRFELGLAFADDATFEVRVRSPEHATVRLTGLRMLASVWHDLGAITLEPGAVVSGRVTVQGSPGLAVPRAVVRVTSGGAFADPSPSSGRGGQTVEADLDGAYVVPHAPTRGVVQVSATAPGFARVVRRDVILQPDQPTVVDFALPPDRPLLGSVRDARGVALADADVQVWPRDSGFQPLRGRSDAAGRFRVRGLRPGAAHRVVVTLAGYASAEFDAVRPEEELACELQRQARLQVSVSTPAGAVVRSYRLALRRYFPSLGDASSAGGRGASIGAVPEVPELRVRLDHATDVAEVPGVPAGSYVAEVRAPDWAKSFSQPFLVAAAAPAAGVDLPSVKRVDVVLTAGATLRGRVLDRDGRPLAGAKVTTQPPGTMPDHRMLAALQRAVPPWVTLRTAETDERGWFTLDRLAAAVYQLQIEHPEACRRTIRDIDCKTILENTLQPITLRRGARVGGRVTVDGEPKGQIRVILTTSEAAPADQSLRAETVTDREGRYAFARRIPPGDYVLRAAVTGGAQPDTQLFRQMLQLEQSTTPVRVAEGQTVVEQRLDLHAN